MATEVDDDATGADERTKPPFLRRVRIRGYKSIGFCDVALQPLTILVGRNASGKSNFLDALAFLRDVLGEGVDEAVRMHGGRKAILPRSSRGMTVSIGVEAGFRSDILETDCVADYSIKLRLPRRSKPAILSERGRMTVVATGSRARFDRKDEHVKYPGDSSQIHPQRCSADHSVLGRYGTDPLFEDLSGGLQAAGFYNFSPEAIRQLQQPTHNVLLERDGRNLASIIEGIREIDPGILSRVDAYLTAIVSEVKGFKVVRYGEYETVRFQLQSDTGDRPLQFDAASMSDGTLRALAALVAAFRVQLPSCPNLVGIEEPETSLHPAAMRALVDALDEATGRTQILLTTHSADLLADRDLDPSQVLVVRNRSGQTQITPVDAASREIVEKELYTLADLQRQDLLDLDAADLQRQAAEQSGDGKA